MKLEYPFTPIPRGWVFNSDLSANELAVMVVIFSYSKPRYPSYETISKHTKLSRATVGRIVKELKQRKWIKVIRERRSNIYECRLNNQCHTETGTASNSLIETTHQSQDETTNSLTVRL